MFAAGGCGRRAARGQAPLSAAMELLRHDEPQIRADACRCTRRWGEAIPLLRELLDDLHRDVRIAAACALGRIGRSEARELLVGYFREEPTAELIDAIAPIADNECVVLLGRVARSTPHLSECAVEALDSIDRPRADKIIAALRESGPG
jgi:hypothetical protein